nr:hypothetical protein [Siccirubricoccus sp. G192]
MRTGAWLTCPACSAKAAAANSRHHVAALEEAEVAPLLRPGAGGAAARHRGEILAAADLGQGGPRLGLGLDQDVAGMHLLLPGAAGGFLVVAGADGGLGHGGAHLAGEQGLGQLLLLGPADAGAHLLVAVEPGGAGGGDQGPFRDGALHELAGDLGRQHLQQHGGRHRAHLGRQHLGRRGGHVREPHFLAIHLGDQGVLGRGSRGAKGRGARGWGSGGRAGLGRRLGQGQDRGKQGGGENRGAKTHAGAELRDGGGG